MKKKPLIFLFSIILAFSCLCIIWNLDNDDGQIPRIYLEGDISAMETKEDVRSIRIRYEDGRNSFRGHAELKIQGMTSVAYDKKNYTIKLFKDAKHNNKLKVNFGWGSENKYCLKANWVDKTHARNIVTANLYTDIQNKYGVLNTAPANGATDGFPVEVYDNGTFLGLYTLNIPRDAWMYAMERNNPNHIAVCAEDWYPANLFEEMPDFTSWAIENGTPDEQTLDKLNVLFDFVINSSDEEFRDRFEDYIDLDAALNYYVLSDFAYLRDNRAKNMVMVTYDGVKWYPVLYDLDTSWGVRWNGLEVMDYENTPFYMEICRLWARLRKCFPNELAERYFELREDLLTKESIMARFEEFRAKIPEDVFEKEALRWGDEIPGFGYDQIDEYLNRVTPGLDKKYTFLRNK